MPYLKCFLSLYITLFYATGCKTALTLPQQLQWDTQENELLGQPLSLNDQDYIFSLGMAHEKPLLAYGHHVFENQELTLATWQPAQLNWRSPLHHSQYDCLDVVFSPDDQTILTASTDGFLRFFDVAQAQVQALYYEGHAITRVAYAPQADGLLLVPWMVLCAF